MPLSRGCSPKSISKNISTLISGRGHKRSRSQKQAIAIALKHARSQGCRIPRSNPQYTLAKWFDLIYRMGKSAAKAASDTTSPILATSAEVDLFYKQTMRNFEEGYGVIFNKIEKELYLEGFLHELMNLL